VTGQQDDEPPGIRLPGASAFPGESADDDVLELGADRPGRGLRPSWWPSWRPPRLPRFAAILVAAALVVGLGVGLGVGYPAGVRHQAAGTPAATAQGSGTPAASVAAGGPTLAQTGNLCSAQQGTTLQLGIQLTNDSATPLALGQVRAVLPLGGLEVTGWTWGSCGELNIGPHADGDPQGPGADQYLLSGASGWVTVTARVLVACPSPLPVQFVVSYEQHGKLSTVQFPGFEDLSAVPYSGCPAS
jgi:hypothetical protein